MNQQKTLTQRRIDFTTDLTILMFHAIRELHLTFYLKEVERNPEYQEWLYQHGLSKTKNPKHPLGLAADIVIIKDGQFSTNIEDYRPLGEFWEQMGHTWGGNWKWRDIFHFEE